MSKVPALKVLLEWVESVDDQPISEALVTRAASGSMTPEQVELLNSTVWGFISGCVSGEAETVFKRADELNGLDAWRRLVRFIDHGRGIRLDALRSEVRALHLKPMTKLEHVAIGIAEFENKLREYEDAGGRRAEDAERKADLLAILPQELRENLLGRAADSGPYDQFRDMVQAQAAKILLTPDDCRCTTSRRIMAEAWRTRISRRLSQPCTAAITRLHWLSSPDVSLQAEASDLAAAKGEHPGLRQPLDLAQDAPIAEAGI